MRPPAYANTPNISQDVMFPIAQGDCCVPFGGTNGPTSSARDCSISAKDSPINILRYGVHILLPSTIGFVSPPA